MKNKKFLIVALVVLSIGLLVPNVASAYSIEQPEVVGNVTAETPKSAGLTDQELIDLFNVSTRDGSDIEVFTDYVNFSVPGTYQVIFSSVNAEYFYGEGSLHGFLTITDSDPVINVETKTQSVMQNKTNASQEIDYKELFGVEAHEFVSGDLTDAVTVNDSAVNLNSPNNYPVIFSVTDSQGNKTSKTVTLTVTSGKPVVTGDYFTRISTTDGPLTDQELIDLLNIKSTGEIVVDQSAVNYGTSGEYHVSFRTTNEYGSTLLQASLIIE